ncbi:flagellar motor protein MotB [Alienimonas sp. DA493]|uniref:OmpA/MotB family protein n=1 Tax=Alienimonas sp. DA493 TaxID=3373605 RepID=UPI0037548512
MDDDAPPGVPEWVVTYGDMMSLLLTFFIMLVSMSEIKQEGKVRAILEVFQQRFGPAEAVAAAPGPSPLDRNDRERATASGQQRPLGTDRETADARETAGTFNGAAEAPPDRPPALAGPAAFPRFGAEVGPAMKPTLDALAAALNRTSGEVIVRGHASPERLPDDSPFEDVWALSRARAEAVAAALEQRGVAAARFCIESAGATTPPGPEGWTARDRPRAWDRVDVLVGEN